MARISSVALGGFYATPPSVVSLLAGMVRGDNLRILDPCAGEGAALEGLAQVWGKRLKAVYACELERGRFVKLKARMEAARMEAISWNARNNLEGDAFRIRFDGAGATVLFLNPPYDYDRDHGRLEEKFLVRFVDACAIGGILLFIVPFYALKASAKTIAKHFEQVVCFRFPEPEFQEYKQVVLIGRRRQETTFGCDEDLKAQIELWSESAADIPVLGEVDYLVDASPSRDVAYRNAFHQWTMESADVKQVFASYEPWTRVVRRRPQSVVEVQSSIPLTDLLLRRYPVVTPPRPAHIAAGIASGIFNGEQLTAPNFPNILVKGVFEKEFKTVEVKERKGGGSAEVQVQQPKLVVTVLDLSKQTYATLPSTRTNATEPCEMGVPDLLQHYGASLTGVLEKNCPIQYDPRVHAGDIQLPELARPLFTAQAHAARALIRVLGESNKASRKGKAVFLLGEIGCGKSSCALAVGSYLRAQNMLVMCPPHLLSTWQDEVRKVTPEVECLVLGDVEDVDHFAALPAGRRRIALLSREAAKLGHARESVKGQCPSCGQPVPLGDLAKKRAKCDYQSIVWGNPRYASVIEPLAHLLEPTCLHSNSIQRILGGAAGVARRKRYQKRPGNRFPGIPADFFDSILPELVYSEGLDYTPYGKHAGFVAIDLLVAILHALQDDMRTAYCARVLFSRFRVSYSYENRAASLAQLIKDPELRAEVLKDVYPPRKAGIWASVYDSSETDAARVARLRHDISFGTNTPVKCEESDVIWVGGTGPATVQAALMVLDRLVAMSNPQLGEPCGEYLFQAVPEPRRMSLAKYITRKYKNLFDFFVLDECHEYANEDTSQGVSAHRILSLGMPAILMTGTIMNGYATSLFSNMWSASPGFREEFEHDESGAFVNRYGYLKQIVEEKEASKVVGYGSVSDKKERSSRTVGVAPGILPLFLFKHLLACSVTLHKDDLAQDLPECTQERVPIEMPLELERPFSRLINAIKRAIQEDRFNPELSGKLFGQLSELPSYLDRATADMGNMPDGSFELRYPESVGSQRVAVEAPLPADWISPKEAWMIEKVKAELAEGRNSMVFAWHVSGKYNGSDEKHTERSILLRLARLIREHCGAVVTVMHADKVPPKKRLEWIDKQVKSGMQVLVTNPVAISTGLNNLVHFCTEIWMENPAVNPNHYRQSIGRVDRIGQTRQTRIFFPVYRSTHSDLNLQERLYDLLLRKVAVATSTDGLDNDSILAAAGLGDDDSMMSLSIGRQIWAMLTGEES